MRTMAEHPRRRRSRRMQLFLDTLTGIALFTAFFFIGIALYMTAP